MELSKRKSLLTPAAPTVWGMIYGDISKQQDIVDVISEKFDQIKSEVFAEINPILDEIMVQKQPTLISGENIKTLKGRSILGDGDLDPLTDSDRNTLATIETKADKSTTYTKGEVDSLIANVEIDDSNLATKTELQQLKEGDVDTALRKSSEATNIATSAANGVAELRGYVDEQIGVINIITEDILA